MAKLTTTSNEASSSAAAAPVKISTLSRQLQEIKPWQKPLKGFRAEVDDTFHMTLILIFAKPS
jgi:hypothetical protein